jgi:group II intron reverse transcriptase/maturase
MQGERRDPPLQPTLSVNPHGEEREAKAKPYRIPKRWVQRAYARVKANRGAAGVDGESLAMFEQDLKNNLYKVWNRMSSGSYFPPPVRRAEIPKRDGGVRPLGIPTVGDRVAQAVVKMVLEPTLERVFHPDSYGYRPGKSAHDALAVTRQRCWKYDWVIDLDIKGFFDAMPHDLVERAVARHTELPWVRLYIARWLRAPVQELDGTLSPRTQGTPQGGVISPLLANLFLHYAFDAWMQRHYAGVPFARYADDIIVHCRTKSAARAVLGAIRERFLQCGLELHPTKTRIVYCKDARRRGEYESISFDFLSYTFQPRAAKGRGGTVFLAFLPALSARAAHAIWAQIRAWRFMAKTHLQLSDLAVLTNATVRGWVTYFGRWYRSECLRVLRALNRALERWAHRKLKRCRQSWGATRRWLQRVAHRTPQLFALWELGAPP